MSRKYVIASFDVMTKKSATITFQGALSFLPFHMCICCAYDIFCCEILKQLWMLWSWYQIFSYCLNMYILPKHCSSVETFYGEHYIIQIFIKESFFLSQRWKFIIWVMGLVNINPFNFYHSHGLCYFSSFLISSVVQHVFDNNNHRIKNSFCANVIWQSTEEYMKYAGSLLFCRSRYSKLSSFKFVVCFLILYILKILVFFIIEEHFGWKGRVSWKMVEC